MTDDFSSITYEIGVVPNAYGAGRNWYEINCDYVDNSEIFFGIFSTRQGAVDHIESMRSLWSGFNAFIKKTPKPIVEPPSTPVRRIRKLKI